MERLKSRSRAREMRSRIYRSTVWRIHLGRSLPVRIWEYQGFVLRGDEGRFGFVYRGILSPIQGKSCVTDTGLLF